MLSILIPVYNYNVLPLVEELHQQATRCNILFEIVVIDDASPQPCFDSDALRNRENVRLFLLRKNIGRSAIRNLLANKAIYENLLFIDAGTFPKPKFFIANYIKQIDKSVIIGSIVEEEKKPKKPYKLRWLYTKTKESNNAKEKKLTSGNFLIKKAILEKHPFNEDIKTYGYEDYMFFRNLMANNITIDFIDNPIIHDSKENANTFIKKTEQALNNLKRLEIKNAQLFYENKIIKLYKKLNRYGLDKLVIILFKITKPLLMKNFNSASPSIMLFDFYKLGYFCTLKQKR